MGSFLIGLAMAARQDTAANPADERAQALTQKICSGCHEMDTVTAERRTRIGWQRSVEDMAGRGADGSEQEMAEVVAYLTRHYGKVNVNTATGRDLQEFLGLTEKEAQTITAYRDGHGQFKDFDSLAAVPEVNAAKLREKRSLIAFSQ